MCWLDTSFFFFSSRRRHTRCYRDWSSDVCSSDLHEGRRRAAARREEQRVAAVELAELLLRLGDGRAVVPGVVEASGLAVLVVRPDRRTVERLHAATLS